MGNLENWETLTAPGSRAVIDVTQETGFPSWKPGLLRHMMGIIFTCLLSILFPYCTLLDLGSCTL